MNKSDYLEFTRELRQRLDCINALDRLFFELDDICDNVIKRGVSIERSNGSRENAVDAFFGPHQEATYERLANEVFSLNKFLMRGKTFFAINEADACY